jgi:hypothetical protein
MVSENDSGIGLRQSCFAVKTKSLAKGWLVAMMGAE